jgi:hypothetical protein
VLAPIRVGCLFTEFDAYAYPATTFSAGSQEARITEFGPQDFFRFAQQAKGLVLGVEKILYFENYGDVFVEVVLAKEIYDSVTIRFVQQIRFVTA